MLHCIDNFFFVQFFLRSFDAKKCNLRKYSVFFGPKSELIGQMVTMKFLSIISKFATFLEMLTLLRSMTKNVGLLSPFFPVLVVQICQGKISNILALIF